MEKNYHTHFIAYFKNDILKLVLIAFFSITISTKPLLLFYLMKQLIDNFNLFKGRSEILIFGIIMFCIIIIYWFLDCILIKVSGNVSAKFCYNMRKDFFELMQNIPYNSFVTNSATDISTNIIQDIDILVELFVKNIISSITQIIFFTTTLIILFKTSSILTLFLLIVYTIIYFIISITKRYQGIKFEQLAKVRTNLNSNIKDITDGQEILKHYNAQEFFLKRLSAANKEYNKEASIINFFDPTISSTIILGTMATYVVIFSLGPIWLSDNRLTYGEIFLFLTYMPQLWDKFKALVDVQRIILNFKVYNNRVFSVLSKKGSIATSVGIENNEKVDMKFESLKINKLSFSYDNNKIIIKNISLDVCTPSLICITGPSGCGKSTLFDLILRFYEFSNGEIMINNRCIKEIPIPLLRDKVGLIHQLPILINDSVINNILIGNKKMCKAEVIEIAKKWNLHKYIEQLDQKYETNVGHLGEELSIGQRRIIAILRTLCADPDIVLIDEITSNVDSHSEIIIREIVQKLAKTKLCLLITHKTEDLIIADKVIPMEIAQ